MNRVKRVSVFQNYPEFSDTIVERRQSASEISKPIENE